MDRRFFTENEIQQIEQESGLREAGLDVDYDGATQNANLVLNHFLQQNPSLPVTVANIYALVESRKNDFIWRTPAQRQYDRVSRQSDPAQVTAVGAWLQKQNILVKDNDASFDNVALLLPELRGRQVSDETILQALGRVQARGGKLHFAPRPTQTNSLLHNHAQDIEPDPKTETRRYVGGKLNHASVPTTKAEGNESTPTRDAWHTLTQNLAESGTHGQQAQLQAVITQNLGKSWREIYRLVEQAKRTFDNRLVRK